MPIKQDPDVFLKFSGRHPCHFYRGVLPPSPHPVPFLHLSRRLHSVILLDFSIKNGPSKLMDLEKSTPVSLQPWHSE